MKIKWLFAMLSASAVLASSAAVLADDTTTSEIGVVFSATGTSGEYNVTLKALDGKAINQFQFADLAFSSPVEYDILPVTDITVTEESSYGSSREYKFTYNGSTAAGSETITIGTVRFYGSGELNFKVDTAYSYSVTGVNKVGVDEGGVDRYYTLSDAGNKLLVGNDITTGLTGGEMSTITDTLTQSQKTLTVNIDFPNNVDNNIADFQDMKLTVSGGDLPEDKVTALGSDNTAVEVIDNKYTVTIPELTANRLYNVKIEGAGYRTARYTVLMDNDKTLNFWNNVASAEQAVEVGKDSPKTATTFLAGDIVRDNEINIYDLSAVISYFGGTSSKDAHWDHIMYDLNRDGSIDSKDIAYVLISWKE